MDCIDVTSLVYKINYTVMAPWKKKNCIIFQQRLGFNQKQTLQYITYSLSTIVHVLLSVLLELCPFPLLFLIFAFKCWHWGHFHMTDHSRPHIIGFSSHPLDTPHSIPDCTSRCTVQARGHPPQEVALWPFICNVRREGLLSVVHIV